jgi:hypothetical protein
MSPERDKHPNQGNSSDEVALLMPMDRRANMVLFSVAGYSPSLSFICCS